MISRHDQLRQQEMRLCHDTCPVPFARQVHVIFGIALVGDHGPGDTPVEHANYEKEGQHCYDVTGVFARGRRGLFGLGQKANVT